MTDHTERQARIRDYKDLEVWQRAIALSKPIYDLTAQFPRSELFGLTTQIRKATISISANIAEGWGRGTRQDYCRFVRMARGSAAEVESELLVAQVLGFAESDQLSGALAEIRRMLQGLVRSLEGS